MADRIRVLPDAVANQIAAGEVVERPASVVKELVENSLDAGATRIEIEVQDGGKRRVRVVDDGVGMSRRDAVLALDRHATSKITEAAELRAVRTFGFRGEALPSVAVVSRMVIDTRGEDDELGTRLTVSGGAITSVNDSVRQPGTTVEVLGLFHNAPARAKFLRPSATEARMIADVVSALSLANPEVSLTLRSGTRVLLDLPATDDVCGRVAQVWGDEAASTLMRIGHGSPPYSVTGFIQRPDAVGTGPRRAYLFVHGRPFKDPRMVRAVERGYVTTVPKGVHPWMFVRIEVPEGDVDVNVHPSKAEVRFRESGRVEQLVEEAVRAALGTSESAATLADATDSGGVPERPTTNVDRVREPGVPNYSLPGYSHRGGGPRDAPGAAADPGSATGEGESGSRVPRDRVVEDQGTLIPPVPKIEPIRMWQVLRTYILVEVKDGILVVDQHSAHERVLFQRMMESFASTGTEAQRLLFPITMRLTAPELDQVVQLGGILRRAGFDVDPFGTDTVILRAAPNPHPYFDAERAFREMVGELAHGSDLTRSAKNQHERIAMTFACKGAIRAGQRLELAEMRDLFDQLFATDLPHHDVHGRPTIIRLPTSELERRFRRVRHS